MHLVFACQHMEKFNVTVNHFLTTLIWGKLGIYKHGDFA